MEDYMFKLVSKASNLRLVVRPLETLQDVEHGVVRGIDGGGHRRSLIDFFRTFLDLRPSCLDSFACALAPLRRCEFGGSSWTAYFAALSSQSYGGGIFLLFHHGHTCIVR